jgi:hypothetical protein
MNWNSSDVIAHVQTARKKITVPFYMYDEDDGIPSVSSILSKIEACGNAVEYKHSSGYWFLLQLQNHRWRRFDKAAAQLFVVPIVPGVAVRTFKDGGFAYSRKISGHIRGLTRRERFAEAHPCQYSLRQAGQVVDMVLQQDSWKRHNGSDHVVCDTDFLTLPSPLAKRWHKQGFFPDFRPNVNWATFEAVFPKQLSAPYMNNGYTNHALEELYFKKRNRDFFYGGSTLCRRMIKRNGNSGFLIRAIIMEKLGGKLANSVIVESKMRYRFMSTKPLCNPEKCKQLTCELGATTYRAKTWEVWRWVPKETTQACPKRKPTVMCKTEYYNATEALLHTEFVLNPRGDTPGTARIMDGLEFGAIPITISDWVYRTAVPFQSFVPYELFTRTIPEKVFTADPLKSTNLAANLTDAQRERMRKLMWYFRSDVLWKLKGSRVAENVLIEVAVRNGLIPRTATPFPDFEIDSQKSDVGSLKQIFGVTRDTMITTTYRKTTLRSLKQYYDHSMFGGLRDAEIIERRRRQLKEEEQPFE